MVDKISSTVIGVPSSLLKKYLYFSSNIFCSNSSKYEAVKVSLSIKYAYGKKIHFGYSVGLRSLSAVPARLKYLNIIFHSYYIIYEAF